MKFGMFCQSFYLRKDGGFRAGLDGFPLVVSYGAEGATSKAATVAGNRELDLLKGWYFIFIVGVR
jgi:hypothetical protein